MLRPLLRLLAPLALVALPAILPAQTLVIVTGREVLSPVPTLWKNDQSNREISDLLFLRLADLGPALRTTDERAFLPRLARRWTRRDSVTLAFELDPRAHWHDGAPVTPADVILSYRRAADRALSPQLSTLLGRIVAVEAEGERTVVVRFREAYAEQLYDATYQAPPLPAHLLARVPPESLATSAFVRAPVGNGPYRWVGRTPGQRLELRADTTFFLGRPGIQRMVQLVVPDGEARANLLRTGEVDAIDNVYGLPNFRRVERLADYAYYPAPGLILGFAGFNFRDPADTSRAHPLFQDPLVRQALVLALDRAAISKASWGPLTTTPDAPLSAIVGRNVASPPVLAYDTSAARRLLARAGWRDTDGDGVLDKGGRPLRFRLMVPSVSTPRVEMATRMQEAWRRLGIAAELDLVEPGTYMTRRGQGRYDLEFWQPLQDPTPSGLVQSWACAGIGGSNVGHYCNPAVDSLLARGSRAGAAEATRRWSEAVARIAEDVPAVFLYALVYGTAVHRRFTNVTIRPESAWSTVWQWRLRPGQALPRDGQ
ncbi:MAG: peptide ABC transporter substrate-binding protein [Gemmatimonadetes bacterium]|nr:peptide ABC transporter substrate-binding protein [Gemmatimonadota bacterium]